VTEERDRLLFVCAKEHKAGEKVLKLFFFTVLESGAPLSSRGLEGALYKFLNE